MSSSSPPPSPQQQYDGNNFDEWLKAFSLSTRLGNVLKEIGVGVVDDLQYLYNDADLLNEVKGKVSPIEFKKFLGAQLRTTRITHSSTPPVPPPSLTSAPLPNKPIDPPIKQVQKQMKEFPKEGVRLSYFLEDFLRVCGGRNELKNLTTFDVCRLIVKPATFTRTCSYVKLLKETRCDVVANANCFISHAWQYPFLSVIDALKTHFEGKNLHEIIIWFDLLSNSQHVSLTPDFDWWSTTFESAIQQFHYTVLVLAPWNDPIPLKRAWCLFEIYCTANSNCKFEIAMNEIEKQSFIEEMKRKGRVEMLSRFHSKINLAQSTSTLLEDKERIFQVVQQTIGMEKLNGIILQKMRTWMQKTTEEEMYNMKSIAADLHVQQGDYKRAEAEFIECLEWKKENLGKDHESTIKSMLDLTSLYAWNMDEQKKAAELAKDCYNICQNVFGELHEETQKALYFIGITETDNHALAEEILLRVQRNRFNLLGEDHPDSIAIYNNLANVKSFLMLYQEADKLYRKCLEKRKMILGENHPKTLVSMFNLALNLHNSKRYEEALDLFQLTYDKSKSVLGENHPDTLDYFEYLAITNSDLGRKTLAEFIYLKLLSKSTAILGEDHKATIRRFKAIGDFYENQSNHLEAAKYYEQCYERRKKVLGDVHLETLSMLKIWASCLKTTERIKDAEKLFQQAESTYKELITKKTKEVGEDDSEIVTLSLSFAALYDSWSNPKQSEALYKACLEKRRKLLGNEHSDTLASIKSLATCYKNQSKYIEAEGLFQEYLITTKKLKGEFDPQTFIALWQLADTYKKHKKFLEAEALFQERLDKRLANNEENYPYTLSAMYDLADIKWDLDKYSEAKTICTRCLRKREEILGKDHPETIAALDLLAQIAGCDGNFHEAKIVFKECYDKYCRIYGEAHNKTFLAGRKLALTLDFLNERVEQTNLLRSLYERSNRLFGANHEDTLQAMLDLGLCLEKQENHAEALPLLKDCYETRRRIFGKEHAKTKEAFKAFNDVKKKVKGCTLS